MHYTRWRVHGDPNYTSRIAPGTPLEERLQGRWKEVPGTQDTPCWEWTGPKNWDGYGVLKYQGRGQGVHRLMYGLHKGEIPEGVNVLHNCDNPPCMNPGHLRLGTQADNVEDMVTKGRQRAPRGLTDEEVRGILAMVKGGMRQSEVVRLLGLESSTVSRVVSRKLYKDVG